MIRINGYSTACWLRSRRSAGELLRDWARPEAAATAEIVVTDRLLKDQ